jgi:hypothetical protein
VNDVVVESAADWPELTTLGAAEIVGALIVGFTVAETAADVTVSAGEPLSITFSSKDHEPIVESVPVGTVGLSPALQVNELPKLP